MKTTTIKLLLLSLFIASCSKVEQTDNSITNTTQTVGAAGISGLNWADGRDNFVDGWVIPSGLTSSDSYSTVAAKTDAVLNGFKARVSGVRPR